MKKYLLIPASAILTALSLMFTPLSFLAWFSIIPYVYFIFTESEKKRHPVKMYLLGLAWALPFYITVYHWFIYMYPMEFLGLTKLQAVGMTALFWFGLSGFQAAGSALLPLVFRLTSKHKLFRAPLLACIWTLFEWLQSLTWTGVPWARMALSQAELPVFIQSSSLLGSLFISFLIVLINALFACAFISFREKGIKSKGVRVFSIIAASLFAANLLFGAAKLALHTEDEGRKVSVILVQGNISSGEKWKPDSTPPLELYVSMSREAAKQNGGKADIILWPESVINYYLLGSPSSKSEISSLAKDTGAIVFAGTLDVVSTEGEDSKVYNAILAFYPDGTIESRPYYKQHLVPFGEYLPMSELFALIPGLDGINQLGSDLTPGNETRIADSALGRFGRLVCFDSIYSELARKSVADGAEMLLLSTNDSWFLDSTAVYQHNRHAALRSVENGRWMLRAANTGVSSIISSDGRIIRTLDPLVRGSVTGEAYFSSSRTLYSYIGDAGVLVCVIFMVFEMTFRVSDAIRKKKKQT